MDIVGIAGLFGVPHQQNAARPPSIPIRRGIGALKAECAAKQIDPTRLHRAPKPEMLPTDVFPLAC
jgi:hypothetical protein